MNAATTGPPQSGQTSVGQSSRWAILSTAVTVTSAIARLFVMGIALDGPEFVDGLFLVTIIPTIATLMRLGLDRSASRLVGQALTAGNEELAQSAFTRALSSAAALGALGTLVIVYGPAYSATLGLFLSTELGTFTRAFLGLWFMSELLRTIIVEVARTKARFLSAIIADSGLRNALFSVLLLLAIISAGATLQLTIIAAGFANIASIFVSLSILPREQRPWSVRRTSGATVRHSELLSTSPALFATVAGAMLLASGDLWIVTRYFNEEASASYLVAFQISSLFALIMTVENTATQPYLARLGPVESKRKALSGILRVAATIGLALAAIGYLILIAARVWGPDQVGGVDVRTAIGLAMLLSAGQVASVACGPCGTAFVLSRQPQLGALVTVSVGIAVLLGELFVARDGQPVWFVAAISGGGVAALNVLMAFSVYRRLGLTTFATLNPRSLKSLARNARTEFL